MGRQLRSRAREDGFTLIELVVVITIIGILLALSVPTYQGVQDGVRKSATESDLRSNRTALTEYSVDNNGSFPAATGFTPTSGASDLTGYGWSQSPETTGYHYVVNTAGTAWCLDMTNATGTVFHVTTNSSTAPTSPTATGLCSTVSSSSF